ncbi:hypothetical protein [Ligilactobacillus aviarius]|uniref:Glycoside hydrolase family 5 domain-containing protein n=1 Tax=Ligilactobacillus aviarius TaxID=1606 RepID=A0A510WQ67_9LACO|nr:hypothetical protein [Ligilactobacillus aviarius]KRM38353.1 hypothetical protein FC33_GL000435 [Ligilactobacillus aviarius subsp. aviarius DSM 20655]GEK41354.1 hypothetical protein LAV01_01860 [Ligilactobacillus aviarius]
MTKKLLDKMGVNVFHDDYSGSRKWNIGQVDRALNFAQMAGIKYIRPAFNLQTDEFNGTDNPWRLATYHKIQDLGMVGVIGAYPQQIKNHLLDSNADKLVDQAVNAYAHIMDRFLDNGITSFIVDAWNEADGKFAVDNQTEAETNDTIIDRYLTFNMKLFEECKKRNVEFMDLCSIQYPQAPNLKHVMDCYNTKLNSYSSLPERVCFHPYCERYNDNYIPELYLLTFDRSNWNNINQIPLAVSEFGFPSEDWGHPFSGSWAFQYSRDVMIRQIIIQDYLGVDPIIIYSANTNPDPSDADIDDCWGAYQYHKDTDTITLSKLGAVELNFFQSMKGYHLNGMVTPSNNFTLTNENIPYNNFAFEYENEEGHKKLFYWNPMGNNTTSLNWNNQTYNLHFTQHVKVIES